MMWRKLQLVNFYLYSLLLIVTPFLLLQNYMQTALGMASRAEIRVFGMGIPVVLILAVVVLGYFFYYWRKLMNRVRWFTLAAIVVLIALGQMTADYYYNHRFYDLQHNWHYIAYGIFAWVAYRRFAVQQLPPHVVIGRIFIIAFFVSVSDEVIQVFISNRVFDLSDCAKDMWGNLCGTVFVFFFIRGGRDFPDHRFWQVKLKDYFRNPCSLLCTEFLFAYVFLWVSSQLAEQKYWVQVLFISLLVFCLLFAWIHLSRGRIARWVSSFVALLLIIWMLASGPMARQHRVNYIADGLITLNGFPLGYFDFLIYPDGGFRAVNKKAMFNYRDKLKLNTLGPDILLLGTGPANEGGKGWNDNDFTEMVYNAHSENMMQIIKLPNRQACDVYNRLQKQRKNVLFIIHNP